MRKKPTLELVKMRKVLVVAVLEVHPRHSQGWLKDNMREQLGQFAPIMNLHVEHINEGDD